MLIVHDLYAAKLTKQWSDLFEPVNYFVGFADDLTPAELKQIMDRVFGRNATFDDYRNPSKFEAFIKGFMSARAPRIRHKFAFVTPGLLPVATPDIPQFRFMGQRYIPDSEILQRLSEPWVRPVPKGLDVMAVLGSPRAIRLLDVFYREPQTWDKYVAERNKLIREFGQLPQDKWTSNMYWGWLWVLKSIIKPYGEGYPSFMRNNSWQDKCLSTALASWAQLRHDTILYAKQSLVAAECGGGERPPKAKGYVEPVPEAFRRLLHLVQLTRKLLTPRGFMTREMSDKLAEFEDMLEFLQRVATKELEGRRLTADEYDQIRLIGSWMEILSLWVMSDGKAKDWYEIQPATDRDMACIADVHTAIDRRPNGLGEVCLEEGVGHAHEIFVIVPIEGELYLTRGAVFSYYEFLQPMRKRLTDEEWQRMLKEGRAPKQPGWTKFFMAKPPKRDVIVAQGRYWGC
ncbi:MAG TPA: DUF3160 domain-containing protein [Armatimonadetes bacterium]|nr:DUF3160 domain-containing protein [Armatimonadota bacterium]